MDRQNLINRLVARKLNSGKAADRVFCICIAGTPKARPLANDITSKR